VTEKWDLQGSKGDGQSQKNQPRPSPGFRLSIKRRLTIVRGHLDGVIRRVEEGSVSHIDLMRQMKAVMGAIDKASQQSFENFIEHQLT
jgi:hypothetical protein